MSIKSYVNFIAEQSKHGKTLRSTDLSEEGGKSPQQKEYEKRGHSRYDNDAGHKIPKGHILKHHRDSDMMDQGYVGKHPEGHSVTDIDQSETHKYHDIHAEVKKQNPHLHPETHKIIAKALHADNRYSEDKAPD